MSIHSRQSILSALVLLSSSLNAQYLQMDFPLHVGNLWQYQEAPGIIWETRATADTILANEKKYTHLEGTLFEGYFRKEDAKVYQFLPYVGFEVLLFDFSKKRGDTVSVHPTSAFFRDSSIVILTDDNTALFFGQPRRYMSFREHEIQTGNLVAFYVVTDSIGITDVRRELIPLLLVGAVINGRRFGTITGVPSPHNSVPEGVELFPNYPNPFNPVTTISFSLPRQRRVFLVISDLFGREVATLLSQNLPAGLQTIHWNAAGLPSGVYFYRLSAGSFVKTRSMVLTK